MVVEGRGFQGRRTDEARDVLALQRLAPAALPLHLGDALGGARDLRVLPRQLGLLCLNRRTRAHAQG